MKYEAMKHPGKKGVGNSWMKSEKRLVKAERRFSVLYGLHD